MRTRKEDRIIQNGSKISEELNRIYLEGICIDEYEKLLNEYKRLYKRYEKTIKVSDNIEHSIINKNESLSDNLDYTIKTARSKLFQNISEHKKTKNALSKYKEEIDQYKKILNELIAEKTIIQKKLNGYVKHFGEIKHQFVQSIDDENKLDNSKNNELQNISLEKVLSLAFIDSEKDFILIKLKLKNFERISEIIKLNASIRSFVEKTHIFIGHNISKDSIIYYEGNGVFYIILINKKIEEAKALENKLNSKRDIYDFEINFNFAISEFKREKDSISRLINRCDMGLKEVIKKDNNLIVV
ncbi:MAG: hypothetical protein KA157_07105 [Aliarcobacter sp.]|jgi:hypothetical protein|nr:hypothetical protein [Aliarcobacter sp.]